jgi:hypothetical protein
MKVTKTKQLFSQGWYGEMNTVLLMIQELSVPLLTRSQLNTFRSLLQRSLQHRGVKGALQDLKSYRVFLTQVCLDQEVTPLSFRKTDRDGFPTALKPFKKLAFGNSEEKRALMSLWRSIELIRVKPDYNTDSIEAPSTAVETTVNEIIAWLPTWTGLRALPKELPRVEIILSSKAGPNGPATASAFADLTALKADSSLYNAVREKLRISKPQLLLEQYEGTKGDFKHSKLAFLSDKAGKTRVIAIGDWWSNQALRDLHQAFMQGLRNLRSDCTYLQGEIPRLVKGLGRSLFSSDMTAFTDRFPIQIEKRIVELAYGAEVGRLWEHIIQKRSFYSPHGLVKYSTGNPMGFLSSWAVSSFTHHAVKEWCAYKLGIRKYDYLVLGDDCLDTKVEVSHLYQATIQNLGVAISRSKCTSSENGYAEFAKRLFTPESEITGLPVDLLTGITRKPEQFIELIRIMRGRGYHDTAIAPGIQALLHRLPTKVRRTVLFVLSAPEDVLGMPPLVIMEGSASLTNPPILGGHPELSIRNHIEQARKEVFWEEVDKLSQKVLTGTLSCTPKQGYRLHIPETHPALAEIGNKLLVYLGDGENEYSMYEAWMSGSSYEMVNVPSIETYRYRNRAHRATRAKYNILSRAKAFAEGSREYRTDMPARISNFELFQMGFPKEGTFIE